MSEDKKAVFLHAWRVIAPDMPPPLAEYGFDKHIGRKHRFDFAFVDQQVAVEVNGNAWGVRGGGRHGNDADLEKLNLAVSMGWRVFQFTPAMLKKDPARWVQMVRRAVTG